MKQHDAKGTVEDLVKYRIETAKSDLKSAIHALDGNVYKRHKDALANFNKDYVKTEIFPRSIGRKIAEAEEIRHASDYDDFYIATKEEAMEQIETAEELIDLVENYFLKGKS